MEPNVAVGIIVIALAVGGAALVGAMRMGHAIAVWWMERDGGLAEMYDRLDGYAARSRERTGDE